jgi:uncharacterized protein (TIGR02118 family)
MIKFIVVLYKKTDLSVEQFRQYFRDVHGPMAREIPGLRRYIQNYALSSPNRKPPGWHGVAELYFDNWQAMEEAWATPEGQRATNDLEAFVDLSQTTWSPVEEAVLIE